MLEAQDRRDQRQHRAGDRGPLRALRRSRAQHVWRGVGERELWRRSQELDLGADATGDRRAGTSVPGTKPAKTHLPLPQVQRHQSANLGGCSTGRGSLRKRQL